MKAGPVLVIVLVCLMVQSASARLGETPNQCAQRYGEPVEERAGGGEVTSVRVYHKEAYFITAVFQKKPNSPESAFCVVYRKSRGENNWVHETEIPDDERASLLATVTGQWDSYELKSQLARPRRDTKPVGAVLIGKSIVVDRRDASRQALTNIMQALIKDGFPPGYALTDFMHNGTSLFAFHALRQLVLLQYDGLKSLESWRAALDAQQIQSSSATKTLDGF